MFSGCSALETLDFTSFDTRSMEEMQKIFYNCSALKQLDLRNFNTEKAFAMFGMFKGCGKLTGIIYEKTWKYWYSEDMFEGGTRLKGAVAYDAGKTDITMANPETRYFAKKPNAIRQVRLNGRNAQGIYTLQGKRVNTEFKHLPAGVYIVNGKKIIAVQ